MTNLMHTYFILQYVHYNPLHVSSITCSSSGGWTVLMQRLVSSSQSVAVRCTGWERTQVGILTLQKRAIKLVSKFKVRFFQLVLFVVRVPLPIFMHVARISCRSRTCENTVTNSAACFVRNILVFSLEICNWI